MSPPKRSVAILLFTITTTVFFHSCHANIILRNNAAHPAAFIASNLFTRSKQTAPPKPYGENISHPKYHTPNRIAQPKRTTTTTTTTSLKLARYDNLLSGIAEISLGFSLGVLWSEYSILTTGCGPLAFSDTLERICYQGVIITAGSSIFCRIAFGKDLNELSQDWFGGGGGSDYNTLEELTLKQVSAAEVLSLVGVIGAFVVLGVQIVKGGQMDGLSGIDVEMCRAIRDL